MAHCNNVCGLLLTVIFVHAFWPLSQTRGLELVGDEELCKGMHERVSSGKGGWRICLEGARVVNCA